MQPVLDANTTDQLRAYMADAHPIHEMLGQTLTQLAACSLLRFNRNGPQLRLEQAMAQARLAADKCLEQLHAMIVSDPAVHHFHHLFSSCKAIHLGFRLLEDAMSSHSDDQQGRRLVDALSLAVRHRRAAASILPGFEGVDIHHACCAAPRCAKSGPQDHQQRITRATDGQLFHMGS
ncbi:hypothetical protein [Sphingobium sp. EP60837]|uniref:hypothetical protein n=1 Tax=Sphingobium sp. EP60837 TaxID=1855519 RepID=UPI0012E8798C|nr:hypothetical protein [Sphingobium sp. EP60837]